MYYCDAYGVVFPWEEVAVAEAQVEEVGQVGLCHPHCLLLRRRRREEAVHSDGLGGGERWLLQLKE